MLTKAGLYAGVCLSCAFGAVPLPSDSNQLDIFIMMGQSNMTGDGGLVQGQDTVSNPRILKWWNTDSVNYNGRASYGWMMGQEGFSQPYWGRCGIGGMCLGPSRAFAQVLVDSSATKAVGVANIGYSGSAIESWVKGGQYYQRNLDWIAQLRRGGIVRGIVWHQGEANSGPMSPSYGQVLARMVADYRADLGLPDLPFIAGTVGTTGLPTDGRVNFALDSLQRAGFPSFRMVSSAGTVLYDNVHYNNVSQRLMGQRYAQAYLAMTGNTTGAVRERGSLGLVRGGPGGMFDVQGRSLRGAAPGSTSPAAAIRINGSTLVIVR
jgi:hypothetical protein